MIKINKPKQAKTDLRYSRNDQEAARKYGVDTVRGKYKFILRTHFNKKKYDQGIFAFDFDDTYTEVKDELLRIQKQKCCYCEAKLTTVNHNIIGNVEHFRPKDGYIQNLDTKKLIKPSYYWLAYEWDNLLFSCEKCNNIKGNFFPLIDDTKRAKNHHYSIEREEPYLINPVKENPNEHFTFSKEYIKPLSVRGSVSIKILGLDRVELEESRRERLDYVENIKLILDHSDRYSPNTIEKLKKSYELAKRKDAKFSAMIRANFPEIS